MTHIDDNIVSDRHNRNATRVPGHEWYNDNRWQDIKNYPNHQLNVILLITFLPIYDIQK